MNKIIRAFNGLVIKAMLFNAIKKKKNTVNK